MFGNGVSGSNRTIFHACAHSTVAVLGTRKRICVGVVDVHNIVYVATNVAVLPLYFERVLYVGLHAARQGFQFVPTVVYFCKVDAVPTRDEEFVIAYAFFPVVGKSVVGKSEYDTAVGQCAHLNFCGDCTFGKCSLLGDRKHPIGCVGNLIRRVGACAVNKLVRQTFRFQSQRNAHKTSEFFVAVGVKVQIVGNKQTCIYVAFAVFHNRSKVYKSTPCAIFRCEFRILCIEYIDLRVERFFCFREALCCS